MSRPAKDRSDRARSGSGRRPYADRAAFRLSGKTLAQDRETIWHQHCGARTLHEPSKQQQGKGRRHRASQRSDAEQQNARDQETSAAVSVSRCSSQQQERAQGKQIGIDDPLQADGVRMKAPTDRR